TPVSDLQRALVGAACLLRPGVSPLVVNELPMLASITLYGRETLSGRSCSSSGSLSSKSRIALLSSSRGSRGSRTASHSGESLHRSSDIIQQLSLHNLLKRLLNLSNRAALDKHQRRLMSAVRLQRHRESLRAVNSLWTFSSLN